MTKIRLSTPEDIPAQRQLWKLCFVGEDHYLHNFFHNYYRPERVFVLEEEGEVRAMTTWFDTTLVVPGRGEFRAAYIYAVGTHPDHRSRGFAAQVMSWAKEHFCSLGIHAVTTVPATPSLHRYYAQLGFRECFVHQAHVLQLSGPAAAPAAGPGALALEPLAPSDYGQLREELLSGVAHIRYPLDALTYQAGCCALAPGGGLYRMDTGHGPALLCAERDGEQLILKELLGRPQAREEALSALPALLPTFGGQYRVVGSGVQFGMLQWLDSALDRAWDWSSTGYLGLAFD